MNRAVPVQFGYKVDEPAVWHFYFNSVVCDYKRSQFQSIPLVVVVDIGGLTLLSSFVHFLEFLGVYLPFSTLLSFCVVMFLVDCFIFPTDLGLGFRSELVRLRDFSSIGFDFCSIFHLRRVGPGVVVAVAPK